MTNNWKSAFAAVALSITMFGAGAAYTSQANAQAVPAYLRGERGSERNIAWVKTRLEGLIDQLQRDQRDYGGHRESALDDMQRARVQLQAAIEYDNTHRR
ncbi:MAG: hypothetical protein JO165_06690 [Candidatus Eremiobacteraeota bacterium]|nr:hypothetical protein [Candidatus Eremiobacteraeota bacterium]